MQTVNEDEATAARRVRGDPGKAARRGACALLLLGLATLGAVLPARTIAQTPPLSPDTLGRLNWGVDEQNQPWTVQSLRRHLAATPRDDLSRQVNRVVQVAEQQLGATITPVAHLRTEGNLSSDPAYRASVAATSQLNTVYNWATCARLADPPLADQCQAAATTAISAWTTTYQPSGNPIDENPLIPLLQSIDLMLPLLSPDQQAQALAWTAELGRQGESLFAGMSGGDTRRINNWNSWHLALQGMVAAITADPALLERTRTAAHAQIGQNVYADGSTYDFRERDALHYHVYDLQALVDLDLFTSVLSADDEAAILSALQFLRPYFLGEQQHIEFANSPVAFDRVRREAGDPSFAIAPWDPARARQLLRLARSRFPAIRAWSASVVDEQYSPRLKELAALFLIPGPD